MTEVNVEHDGFQDLMDRLKVPVTPWSSPVRVYGCDACGCVFLPSSEGELGWYTDRYEHVGRTRTGCDQDCECHALPYTMDNNGQEVEF